MATTDQCKLDQGGSGLVVHGIRSINQGESKYVKPMRMKFTLNGRTREWDCLKAHDSVACIIYNKTKHKLVYVKQFRPAVYMASLTSGMSDLDEFDPKMVPVKSDSRTGFTLELCAGISDKADKNPEQTVQEEILEETGYQVPLESIKFVSSFRGSTGLTGTKMYLYFAEVTDDQKCESGGGIEDESIEVIELDIEEARRAIFCTDEEAPYSRPPAMLVGTLWFLTEYLPKLNDSRR